MNSNYIIRLAKKEDIDAIMEVEKACFALEICESKSVFLERIEVFSQGFYLLEIDNRVVGYISTEIWNYQDVIMRETFELGHSIDEVHTASGDELYISSMGLLPAYRGGGMGKKLFQTALNDMLNKYAQIKSQILIVSEKWEKAVNIYKRNDFKEIKRFDDFFEFDNHRENALVMRKKL